MRERQSSHILFFWFGLGGGSKSYTPPFLIFFVQTFAFPPSNFLGIIIRVVSFRSFTLFVYARFLRLRLIVVGVVVLRDVLLIHYFITLVLNYRRTLPTLFYIISDLPSPPESFFFFFFEREKMRNQTCAVLPPAWFFLSQRLDTTRGQKLRHVWRRLTTMVSPWWCVPPLQSVGW